jgi:hypothetical protein
LDVLLKENDYLVEQQQKLVLENQRLREALEENSHFRAVFRPFT